MSLISAEIIDEIDQLIKSGNGAVAYKKLRKITLKEIPRRFIAKVAGFYRRLSEPFMGVKLLNSIVRSEFELATPASSIEKAEYAICLNSLGAYRESQIILNDKVIINDHPPANLYLAASLVSQWNYEAAIPHILAFIQHAQTDYERLLGKLNYIPCLTQLAQYDDAKKIATEVIENSKDSNLLKGNAHELLGQIFFFQKQYSEAHKQLQLAKALLSNSAKREKQYVSKWLTINEIMWSEHNFNELKNLKELIRSAKSDKSWETQRDCEMFLALSENDEDLLHKVYFGTPHISYRKRILNFWSKPLPKVFLYSFGYNNTSPGVIDSSNAFFNDKDLDLKRSPLLLDLFRYCCRDLYRPVPQAELFGILYQGEYFNPNTSPQKVINCVSRLRQWFVVNKIPLEIIEIDSCYILNGTSDIELKMYLDSSSIENQPTGEENQIFKCFGNEAFTLKDVARLLSVSTKTASRRIIKIMESGRVKKIKEGHSTKYIFLK